MERSEKVKAIILLLHLAAIIALMPAELVSAADATTLQASEPYTVYYTTNGATPVAPTGGITSSIAPVETETISLVPNAGKGTSYVKQQKLKIHESKYEFEKHVKQKHGKRFKVIDFTAKQTEGGLDGHLDIVETRDPSILELSDTCTEEEWAKRVAIARDFILNNPEFVGLTENEELRGRGELNYCGNLYFDRYVNGYKLLASVIHFVFVPQFNYAVSANLAPVTPEMYASAQQLALTKDEVAAIVYNDLNIVVQDNDKNGSAAQKLPKLEMRKYLRTKEPYAIWEVRGKYHYEINAVSGEIVHKRLNIK